MPDSPSEWIGGILTPPFFVTDRSEPYRPPLVVWMELPSGLIVGQAVVAPEDTTGALGRTLRAALDAPLAGPPRRPARIRVADRVLGGEVRAVVRAEMPVVVAPTPELDDMLEALVEASNADSDDARSYLEGGRVSAESMERLFLTARLLWTAAPWRVAYDSDVLRMDIPALGVDGACVSIIGNLGESFGLLIFPSLDAFARFGDAAGAIDRGGRRPDFGTSWIALSFEPGADLPPSMRREIAQHGWSVAAPEAHPMVAHHDPDGAPRPLSQRDVDVARACAGALVGFFAKHGTDFGHDDAEPVCESWFDEGDLEVRFTMPYEALALFDVDEPPPPAAEHPKVGRNDPCPCGSGRKYKRCHLAADKEARAARAEREPPDARDGEFVRTLARYAATRFGEDWNGGPADFAAPLETLELVVPWSVYGAAVGGRRVVDWYLDAHGGRLPPADRAWLDAQRAAWLSVWEVIGVERGVGLTLRDLLSDEVRAVTERTASQALVERDAILARVVARGDDSVLCGLHPRALPPFEAAEVVRLARGRLRRTRAVPAERLRDSEIGRYLIRRWEQAVRELDARSSLPPDLRNTDGDPLLLTIDRFTVAAGARDAVAAALAGLDGVRPPEPGDAAPAYDFLRDGDPANPLLRTTLVGRAWLTASGLRVETNSIERANTLRARIEAVCGDHVVYRIREHMDPMSSKAPRGAPPPSPSPAEQEALRELQRRYYAAWIDEPIPALGGETPRAASRTARGRQRLDVLLRDMENRERRAGGSFDVAELRRTLGLD